MTMKFTKLQNNGDSIGVEMPLPGDAKKRKIGWGLYYEAYSQTYTPAPYIRDQNGNGKLDSTWQCSYVANRDGKTMTAFCSNLLPREGIEGGSFYRY